MLTGTAKIPTNSFQLDDLCRRMQKLTAINEGKVTVKKGFILGHIISTK